SSTSCATGIQRPPFGGPRSTRAIDTTGSWPVASRQLNSSYQEWRRDRPVEATTTYRRLAGKVPTPGRSSCEIRELFEALPPGRVFRFPVLLATTRLRPRNGPTTEEPRMPA